MIIKPNSVMAEDASVQTVLLLHPVNYYPTNNPQIIQNMTFTPPIAIPKPSNLPSEICTISSGIGNFDLNKAPHEMRGECGQSSALNPFGVNYVPNIGVHQSPHAPDHVTYSQYHNGSIFSVPKSWPTDRKEDLVVTVYGLVKTLLGASGTSHGAIDNRIEQAMDLVKSHLMNAVRSEVEELKEKIIRLEDTINNLQSENEFMKKHVTSDVLRQISSTPAPLLAVQQQTQPIASTTGYANVVVNPTAQQAITSSVPAVTNNAVPISNINTNLGTQQATILPNAANTNSVVNPGVANIITPSQTAPTYMPQATGTQVAPANSQLPPANPPQ